MTLTPGNYTVNRRKSSVQIRRALHRYIYILLSVYVFKYKEKSSIVVKTLHISCRIVQLFRQDCLELFPYTLRHLRELHVLLLESISLAYLIIILKMIVRKVFC